MMGLKLHVVKGDKILVGDDCIITVNSLGSRPQLELDAPPDGRPVVAQLGPLRLEEEEEDAHRHGEDDDGVRAPASGRRGAGDGRHVGHAFGFQKRAG